MAAVVKSRERITASFTGTSGLLTQTVNLTKGQDETQCTPLGVTLRFTSNATDARANNGVAVEMIDNAGTPAARVSRRGSSTYGSMTVEVEVVEWGADVTVQQGSATLTGTSTTATITSIDTTRSFVVPTARASASASGDGWNDYFIRASFNSGTQIQFNRSAAGNPDWEIFWYVVTSDNGDFQTEYCTYSDPGGTGTLVNYSLSNTVTLANAFLVVTYQTAASTDDMSRAIWGTYFSSTSQITSVRNTGAGSTTFGVWVVRGSSAEFDVQRFALDCGNALTNDQTITTVDADKAVALSNHHVAQGAWPVNSSNAGNDNDDVQSSLILTSTTNARVQRRAVTTLGGANNNLYFEVIEFELESGAPPAQSIVIGIVSETDSVQAVTPVAGAVSVSVDLITETDTVFAVTPQTGGAPQTISVGLAAETDSVQPVTPLAGEVTLPVGIVSETDTVFPVDPVITKTPQTVSVGLVSETDTVQPVTPIPGTVTLSVGIVEELDQVAPVFPVVEGGPQTVLVINVAEIDTVFPVTPRIGPEVEPPVAGLPGEIRKPKRKTRRFILPDNRVYTDPDRALFELREYLKKEQKAAQAESGGVIADSPPLDASRGQEDPPPDTAPGQPVSSALMKEAMAELPRLVRARPPEAQPLDPQLISVLFQRIDDDEAAMLLL